MGRYIGWWAFLGFGYWAVEERATGAFVGDVGFMDAMRDLVPSISGMPEAGWVLAPAFHGRGYGTEAVAAALAWADATLAPPQTVALIANENAASLALGAKFGYVPTRVIDFAGTPTAVLSRTRNGTSARAATTDVT